MNKFLSPALAALLSGCAATDDPHFAQKLEAVLSGMNQAYNAGYSVPRNQYLAPARDYEWDWDEFYYDNSLVWACRGVQTGQFAEQSNCAYKVKVDFRWPDKWLR